MRIIFCIGLILLLKACIPPEVSRLKPLIVCSTSIIADGIQQVFGDQVDVYALMGPGVDPHTYNPRPSDIHWLNEASVIVCNGFHLEGKMVSLFEGLKQRKPVYFLADHVPQESRILLDKVIVDPHFWFDTELWVKANKGVVQEIVGELELEQLRIKERIDLWERSIHQIDQHYGKLIATIPEEQRVLITSHDAFHYFGRKYQVSVKAIQGISTAQEPSVRSMLDLTSFIVDRKIPAIFVENSVNPKTIQTLTKSCARKGLHVRIGGTLYSDALGTKSSGAHTYTGMIEHNLKTIFNALHGKNKEYSH